MSSENPKNKKRVPRFKTTYSELPEKDLKRYERALQRGGIDGLTQELGKDLYKKIDAIIKDYNTDDDTVH